MWVYFEYDPEFECIYLHDQSPFECKSIHFGGYLGYASRQLYFI